MRSLGAARRDRGQAPPVPTAGLDLALDLRAAAVRYLDLAAAHLVHAAVPTCEDAAAAWAREWLAAWAAELTIDALAARADELEAEAAVHAPARGVAA